MPKPVINQALVDRIVKRAAESDFGLGEGLTHKNGHLQLDAYAEPYTTDTLAMVLVNAYHAKYDLISVFAAAMEELTAKPS